MDTNEHKLPLHYPEVAQFRVSLILKQSIRVPSWFVILLRVFLRGSPFWPLRTTLPLFHVEHWGSLMPLANSRWRLQGTWMGTAHSTPGNCRISPFHTRLVVNSTNFTLP